MNPAAAIFHIHSWLGVHGLLPLGAPPTTGHFSTAVLFLGRDGGAWLRDPQVKSVELVLVHIDSLSIHNTEAHKTAILMQAQHYVASYTPAGVDVAFAYRHIQTGTQKDHCSCGVFAALHAAHTMAKVAPLVPAELFAQGGQWTSERLEDLEHAVREAIAGITQAYVIQRRLLFR